MAKKKSIKIKVTREALKKLPRNEQRRYVDLGFVEAAKPAAAEPSKASAAK
jgi:hypothetical protein